MTADRRTASNWPSTASDWTRDVVQHAPSVALVDLVRRWRAIRANPRKLAALGFVGVFLSLIVAVLFTVAFSFGTVVVRSQSADEALLVGQYAAASLWLLTVALATYRTVATGASIEHRDGLLTTVPHHVVVVGRYLSETAIVAGTIAIGSVPVAIGFGLGTASFLVTGLVLLGVVATVLAGQVVGFVVGLGVKNVAVRSSIVVRYRSLIWIALFVAYIGVIVTNAVDTLAEPIVTGLVDSPIGWYADIALATTTPSASPRRALLAVALTAAIVVIALPTMDRLAALLWYADPPLTRRDSGGVPASRPGPGQHRDGRRGQRRAQTDALSALAPLASRPTRTVLWTCWRRTRRSPARLTYLLYPLVVLIAPISQSVQAGTVATSLPAILGLTVAWSIGAAFALNPLGDEESALPSTLTAVRDARSIVDGHALAGLLVGTPVALGLVFLTGLLSDLTLVETLGTTAVVAICCLASPAIAAGVGCTFPRFEAVNVTRSREAVVPSLLATGAFSVVLAVVATPGLLAQHPTGAAAIAGYLSMSAPAVRLGAILVTAGVALTVAAFWYHHAVLTLGSYCLEDGRRPRIVGFRRTFWTLGAIAVAVTALVLSVVAAIPALLLAGALSLSAPAAFVTVFVASYAGMAGVVVGFLWITDRDRSYLDLAVPTWRDLGYTVVGTVAALGLVFVFTAVVEVLELPTTPHTLFEDDLARPILTLLLPLVLLVNAPVEELVFRNLVQKSLADVFSPVGAILVASVIFALVHVPAYYGSSLAALALSMLVLTAVSSIFGLVYLQTGNLVVPAVVHGTYNAILVASLLMA